MITTLTDFNLVQDTHSFQLAHTQTAVAVLFDNKNYMNIGILLNNIKSRYILKRVEYLNQISHKLQNQTIDDLF